MEKIIYLKKHELNFIGIYLSWVNPPPIHIYAWLWTGCVLCMSSHLFNNIQHFKWNRVDSLIIHIFFSLSCVCVCVVVWNITIRCIHMSLKQIWQTKCSNSIGWKIKFSPKYLLKTRNNHIIMRSHTHTHIHRHRDVHENLIVSCSSIYCGKVDSLCEYLTRDLIT